MLDDLETGSGEKEEGKFQKRHNCSSIEPA